MSRVSNEFGEGEGPYVQQRQAGASRYSDYNNEARRSHGAYSITPL